MDGLPAPRLLPALKLRETGRPTIGDAATPDEILDLIRRRQHDIGLSNAGLEHICGLAAGQVDKYLGPTRNKSPTLYILGLMMDAVGVSATLWIDAVKQERFGKLWERFGRQGSRSARPENGRISKLAIKRARPLVLKEAATKAANARWEKSTPKQRKMVGKYLAKHRWGK
jgi:hypothetical protein